MKMVIEIPDEIYHKWKLTGEIDNFYLKDALLNSKFLLEWIKPIKIEIKETLDVDWSDGLYQALKIIDKHINGKKNHE